MTLPAEILTMLDELLVHVPPGVVELSVKVPPTHAHVPPVIGAGTGSTVTEYIAEPVPVVYEKTTTPETVLVATPLTEPIIATAGLLLLQMPPPVASV